MPLPYVQVDELVLGDRDGPAVGLRAERDIALVLAQDALDVQVARALEEPVDLAVIMVGANDVTHRVRPSEAARDLGRAVRTLRAAGVVVVVGTCPDLGTVKPLLEPLRTVAERLSRKTDKDGPGNCANQSRVVSCVLVDRCPPSLF